MKRFGIILILWCLAISSWSQTNIVQAEYFFDTDPGFGAATAVPAFSASMTIDVNELINVSALPLGTHILGVRVLDSNNDWSIAQYVPFLVTASSAIIGSSVSGAEYYFDSDPGQGLATSISLTAAQNIDINELIPTGPLSLGLHSLNIRVRSEFGEWSIPEMTLIFVTPTSAVLVSDIDLVEYFFDTDPGYGLGSQIPVAAIQNLAISELLPTSTLTPGMHLLHIRVRNIFGEWSLIESSPVLVNQNQPISQLEYFFDADPGLAAATNVSVIPVGDSIDVNLVLPTSALALGPHALGVRIAGANGIWGLTEFASFNICAGATADFSQDIVCLGTPTTFTDLSSNVLAGDIYSWDFDGDLLEDDISAGNTSFTYSTAGTFTATLTIDRGGCISIMSASVTVGDPATASAGTDITINEGEMVSLIGSIGGSAATSTWTTSGDGTFDDSSLLTAVYIPGSGDIVTGSVSLTLTTDDPDLAGPCVAATSVILVTINAVSADILVYDGSDNMSSVIVDSQNIDIGSTELSVNLDREFTIENPSLATTLTIDSIIVDNPVYEILTFTPTVPPSGLLQFTIRLNSINIGTYSTTVTVSTSANVFSFVVTGEVLSLTDPDLNIYNVVTPNGDGIHDSFKIGNISYYIDNSVIIYNRWGDKVFEADNYNNDANAFIGGSNTGGAANLDTGNYYYVIDRGNGTKKITGFLFLKR